MTRKAGWLHARLASFEPPCALSAATRASVLHSPVDLLAYGYNVLGVDDGRIHAPKTSPSTWSSHPLARLEVYDAMAEAARTGVPYVTRRLAPPPADHRAAHPPRPPAPASP
jgi:hypothetical protein